MLSRRAFFASLLALPAAIKAAATGAPVHHIRFLSQAVVFSEKHVYTTRAIYGAIPRVYGKAQVFKTPSGH